MKKSLLFITFILFVSTIFSFTKTNGVIASSTYDSCILTATGDINFNITNASFIKKIINNRPTIVLAGNIHQEEKSVRTKSLLISLGGVNKEGKYYLRPKKGDSTFVTIGYVSGADADNDIYLSLRTVSLVGFVNITSITDTSIVGNYNSNITNAKGIVYSVSGKFSGSLKLID